MINKIAFMVFLVLAGCGSNPARYMSETNSVDLASAFQLIPRDDFEDIDIARLVDPKGKAIQKLTDSGITPDAGQKIDAALEQFYDDHPKNKQAPARDRIQERILAASTQRCNAFKSNLQREYSRTNFVLGIGSTISGVVGAVIPGVQASKNLAAASGIFSGARAEWNQAFLSNLAVNVVIDGIEQRQQDVYKHIVLAGQARSIDDYNLEAAIKDALFYHGQCSIMTGLRVASDAIKLANDPGIDAATRILLKLNNAKKISEGATNDVDFALSSKLDQLSLNQRLFAGTPRKTEYLSTALLHVLFTSKERISEITNALLKELETFEDKKESDSQTVVKSLNSALQTWISGCNTKGLEVLSNIAETQVQLDRSKEAASSIELTGKLAAKNNLAAAIGARIESRTAEYQNASSFLLQEIKSKKLKQADLKDRVSGKIKPINPEKSDICT